MTSYNLNFSRSQQEFSIRKDQQDTREPKWTKTLRKVQHSVASTLLSHSPIECWGGAKSKPIFGSVDIWVLVAALPFKHIQLSGGFSRTPQVSYSPLIACESITGSEEIPGRKTYRHTTDTYACEPSEHALYTFFILWV